MSSTAFPSAAVSITAALENRGRRLSVLRPLRRDVEVLLTEHGDPFWAGRAPVRPTSGTVFQPVEIDEGRLEGLVRQSLAERHERVVWVEAGDEVVVELAKTRVAVRTGAVVVGLPLQADDGVAGEVTVPLAVGTPERITGLLAVTPRAPGGLAALVLRWGDAVVAAAWGALIDVVTEVAGAAGEDETGAPLQPAAIVAEDRTLGIVLQARPTLDALRDVLQRPRRDEPRGGQRDPTTAES